MRVLSWFHSMWLWRHFSGHVCHLFATWLHPGGRTTMWNKHQRSRTDGTLVTSAREVPFCSRLTRLPAPREANSTRPPLQSPITQVPPGRPEVLPGHGAQLQERPNQGPVFGWSSSQARPSTSPRYRRNRHTKVIPSSVAQQHQASVCRAGMREAGARPSTAPGPPVGITAATAWVCAQHASRNLGISRVLGTPGAGWDAHA